MPKHHRHGSLNAVKPTNIERGNHTVETKLIEGVEPRPIDKKVLAVTRKNASEWDYGDRWRIAIRNQAGAIYRTIKMDSMGIYAGIETGLHALGLRNEVTGNRPVDGFDAIFRLPDATTGSDTQP